MPRNASSVYSQPVSSVSPSVSNTTIDPSAFNGLMTDLSTEMTNSLDRGGRGAMTAALPMGGFKITNLGAPTAGSDAATLAKVNAPGPMTANVSFGGFKITSLGTPAATTDGVTKAYADALITGLTYTKTISAQQFTATGTYTPHASLTFAIIECVGGGGGGGGSANTAPTDDCAGGGGGGGGYSRTTVTAAQVGASKAVTIPAAAAGGASGNNAGAAGGDVSVGVLCIAKGGLGGQGHPSVPSSTAVAGTGGVAGTGDDTFTGDDGDHGQGAISSPVFVFGGNGAGGPFGGRTAGPTATNGFAGTGFGAGGTGGESSAGGGGKAGGNGAKGYVRITEFSSA